MNSLPKLGPDLHINMNQVEELRPDLAIASLSVPGMEKVVADLEKTGIPYIVLSPHSIEDIFTDMETLSDAIHDVKVTTTRQQVVQSLRDRVSRIETATRLLAEKPRIYWEWWPSPVFSPAKNNWLTELSALAGAMNIFADVDGDQVQDDGQKVISLQPDYFLAAWTGVPQHKVPLQKILRREGWDVTPAFQSGRVFILPEGLYCRPSPRLIDGLEQIVSLLHPNIATSLGLNSPHEYGPVRNAAGTWLGNIYP